MLEQTSGWRFSMNHVALVTGASSGIGRALLDCFAAEGIDLVITARDEASLNAAAAEITARYGVAVTVIPLDLAEPRAAHRLFEEVGRRGITVEYLVNNAGFGHYGFFHEATPTKMDEMVQVNVAALVTLTRLFLPEMVARGRGRILQIASLAGFQPGPLMAVYYATKAFVVSCSEAVAEELRGSGVTVTCLCPGATHTDFARRAGIEDIRLFRMGTMEARQVAKVGYAGMLKGKTTVIPGLFNQLLALSIRFTPRRLVTRISKYLMARA